MRSRNPAALFYVVTHLRIRSKIRSLGQHLSREQPVGTAARATFTRRALRFAPVITDWLNVVGSTNQTRLLTFTDNWVSWFDAVPSRRYPTALGVAILIAGGAIVFISR